MLPLLLSLEGGRGVVGPGSVWQGRTGSGKVTVADGSTEDFGPLCCSLWRVDDASYGTAWPGRARHGTTSYGEATVADGSTGTFGSLCCSLRRVDKASPGQV